MVPLWCPGNTALGASKPLHASLLAKVARSSCHPFSGVWGPGTTVHDRFGWRHVPKMNEQAAHLFAARGHQVLHAYMPYMLRADSHIGARGGWHSLQKNTTPDCLHHCLPGPPRMMALAVAQFVLGVEHHQPKPTA